MPIVRRSNCVSLPIVVSPVVAVVMLESGVTRCVHTVHTSCHPTLQHHNSYNRTDNYRQWNAVGSPDDGHKDARNMLRYYWLPINQYLLHLVGLAFTYLRKYLSPRSKIAVYYDHNLLSPLWLKWSRRPIWCYNSNLYNKTSFLVPGFRCLLHFIL